MRVSLTPAEFAEIVADATRDETGMLLLDIPDTCIQRDCPRLVLSSPNVVCFGDQQATLTPTQHAIMAYIQSRGGSATHQDAVDAVWFGREISEAAIRQACSKLSTRLLEAGLPFSISAAGGHIQLVTDL